MGWLVKDGSIEQISIVIKYHTFPKKNKNRKN